MDSNFKKELIKCLQNLPLQESKKVSDIHICKYFYECIKLVVLAKPFKILSLDVYL